MSYVKYVTIPSRAYLYRDDTVSGCSRNYSYRSARRAVAVCDFDFATALRGHDTPEWPRDHEEKIYDFTLVNLYLLRALTHRACSHLICYLRM